MSYSDSPQDSSSTGLASNSTTGAATGSQIGSAAQYLLRIDDLTPTMFPGQWSALYALIQRYGLQPILAIVPDNQDPSLGADVLNPHFWPQMLALQSTGASIGLHGYRHLSVARGWGLVPLHRHNEFVGVSASVQREWIGQGISLLQARGLAPSVWVAPRHGFDEATLDALRTHGITVVSDGFARRPHYAHGCTWIPQQLWEPVSMPSGLWTICLHPSTLTMEKLRDLEEFLTRHRARFTSVARILAEWPIDTLPFADHLFTLRAYARFHARRLLRPR
jgi:hypothetical protein